MERGLWEVVYGKRFMESGLWKGVHRQNWKATGFIQLGGKGFYLWKGKGKVFCIKFVIYSERGMSKVIY